MISGSVPQLSASGKVGTVFSGKKHGEPKI